MKSLVVLALLSSMSAGAMAAQANDHGEGYQAGTWGQAVRAEAQKLRAHPVHRSSYWNTRASVDQASSSSTSPFGLTEASAKIADDRM